MNPSDFQFKVAFFANFRAAMRVRVRSLVQHPRCSAVTLPDRPKT
ncbi:hypothetical protein Z945_2583 [Sulfitobacter noctilucae]|nr:hypothetical protein Z945_2583 [Sulfitobacter noctilucae]